MIKIKSNGLEIKLQKLCVADHRYDISIKRMDEDCFELRNSTSFENAGSGLEHYLAIVFIRNADAFLEIRMKKWAIISLLIFTLFSLGISVFLALKSDPSFIAFFFVCILGNISTYIARYKFKKRILKIIQTINEK